MGSTLENTRTIQIVTASELVVDADEAELMCDLGVVKLDRMTSDEAWLVTVRGRQKVVPDATLGDAAE